MICCVLPQLQQKKKKPRFSFSQERVLICLHNSPFWFVFLKLSMVHEYLKHPRGPLSFSQNKNIKNARVNGIQILYKEWFSQLVSRCIVINTLGVRSQNNWGIQPLNVQEINPWRRVLHFKETVLNVTFNGNSIGKWNCWKFNVRATVLQYLSSRQTKIIIIKSLNESQNNFDKHTECPHTMRSTHNDLYFAE